MKSIRKTFVWMFVIAAILLGGIGWWGYDLWSRKNEFIRDTILAEFAESAPGWELKLATCRFDFLRKIQITDLSLRRRIDDDALMNIEQCVVTIDRDRLFDHHEVEIQHIKLTHPTVKLRQDATGRWAWQDFPTGEKSTQTPEIEIEHGNLVLQFHENSSQSGNTVSFTDVNLKLVPDGNRQFLIEAATSLEAIPSRLKLNGKWNLDLQTGSINGEISGLTIGDELVRTMGKHMPIVAEKLSALREQLAIRIARPIDPASRASISLNAVAAEIAERLRRDGGAAAGAPPMVGSGNEAPLDRNVLLKSLGGPALGLVAKANVNFRLARWKKDGALETKVLMTLTGGTIENPILPYRLTHLGGKLYFDNRQILIRDLTAIDGQTRFELDGRMQIQNGMLTGELDIDGTNMNCDKRLRSRLAPRIARVFDMHQPQGTFDAKVTVVNDGSDKWTPKKLVLTAKGISARNEIFPYPATDIMGTIKQVGANFEFDLQGMVGRRPAWLVGRVPKPGPQAQTVFDIRVNELPIDDNLLAASHNLKGMHETLTALQLRGLADVYLRLTKVGTDDQRFHPQVHVTLKQCTVKYRHFPYTLTNLSGVIGATGSTWTFTKLKAKHGSAKLTGSGSYTQPNGQGLLRLTVNATGVDLDKDLYRAVPVSTQRAWSELAAGGKANITTEITWSDPQPPRIALPKLDLYDGTMQIQAFPYRIKRIQAKLAYDESGRLSIKSFVGHHRDTVIRGRGFGYFQDNGDWTLRLNSLKVDNLLPDTDLRVALSDDLRAIVECLEPNQAVTINGMLELRGTPQPDLPVTAAWDIETSFSGGKIAVGVDLVDTSGTITSRGTWDGNSATISGDIDLVSTTVLGYRIYEVRGPYRVDGDKIIIGNGGTLEDKRDGAQALDHVTGRAIGGVIKLDALAFLNEKPDYRVKLDLSHGKMERYAAEYMSNQKKLRGVMNGWIDLHGRGPSTASIIGRGQLQISPAALYELPVMAQIFGALHTGVPDATAFRYALLDFNVGNNSFLFNGIDLIGESISLHSRGGRAGFNGTLDMDFYSRLPRAQVPIPLLEKVLGQATTGWVSVEVRGSTDNPIAKVKPAPLLNDALKQFLQAFEVRPPLQPPGTTRRPRLPTARNRRPRNSTQN